MESSPVDPQEFIARIEEIVATGRKRFNLIEGESFNELKTKRRENSRALRARKPIRV